MSKSIPSKKTLKSIRREMEEIFQKWRLKFVDNPHQEVHLFGRLSDNFYYDFYNDFIKLSYKAITVIYDPRFSNLSWSIDLEYDYEVDWEGLLREIRDKKTELLNLCKKTTIIWTY